MRLSDQTARKMAPIDDAQARHQQLGARLARRPQLHGAALLGRHTDRTRAAGRDAPRRGAAAAGAVRRAARPPASAAGDRQQDVEPVAGRQLGLSDRRRRQVACRSA